MADQKFNRLTFISKCSVYKEPKWHHDHGIFKCDCGKEIKIRLRSVLSGNTTSCGCYNRDQVALFTKMPFGIASSNQVLRIYKIHAKERSLSFDISKEYFMALTKKNCHYCNLPPSTKCHPKGSNGAYIYNGIDRIDNAKGYTMENCVTCCEKCNAMKEDHSLPDFLKHIKKIYDFMNRNV